MHVKFTPEERIAFVKWMFARVVPRYDLLNHVHSLGQDIYWRKAAARRAKVFQTGRILDLAVGTADMAMALKDAFPKARIIGADFSYPMMKRGQEKLASRPDRDSFHLTGGDALHLPFPDHTFDSLTIAFGIRNIPYHDQALKEMHRVLVPGGRVLVLEMTFPRWSFIRLLFNSYLNELIPKFGGLVSGVPEAYEYLADSIMDFPGPEEFCRKISRAGFESVQYKKLTFGIAVVHWGEAL